MIELEDKNFDEIFRKRITESYPAFEEEAWQKMEQKLKKKDRLVFYKYASVVLLLLSFGLSFHYFNFNNTQKQKTIIALQHKNKNNKINPITVAKTTAPKNSKDNTIITPSLTLPILKFNKQSAIAKTIIKSKIKANKKEEKTPIIKAITENNIAKNNIQSVAEENKKPTNIEVAAPTQPIIEVEKTVIASLQPTKTDSVSLKKIKKRNKLPISLAINVGPDFNSSTALVGGKANLAVGFSVGAGITKKLSIETGVNYGVKNYDADGFSYQGISPSVQANILAINASCNVLEIPLRAAYTVTSNAQRSISLNAGLSSYLMLKENYIYQYKTYKPNKIVAVNNANQHYFGVLDLSATYNIKLKNKKFGFGLTPYVKVPLTGVGEGKVNLKSSGIALNLKYDFNKKQ